MGLGADHRGDAPARARGDASADGELGTLQWRHCNAPAHASLGKAGRPMKSRGGRTLSRRRLPVEPAFLTAIDAARRIEKAARCRSSMHNAPEKLRTRLLGAARGPRILRRRP